MALPVIVTGDDAELFVTLTKQGATFAIAPSDIVKAAVVSQDNETVLMPAVAQSDGAAGADWANSLVAVNFSAADTVAITQTGAALLAIQVELSGKKTTWFGDVIIIKGNID